MKHKKLIIFCFLLLIIYLIYMTFHNDKINYLAIGDSLSLGVNAYNEEGYGYSDYLASYLKENNKLNNYSKDFAFAGFRIADLQHQLDMNQVLARQNKTLSFKKCLREADLVTISIGGNDLLTEINMSTSDISIIDEKKLLDIFSKKMKELDNLLKSIRKYNNRKIILLGYYNPYEYTDIVPDRVFAYFDEEMKKVTTKYDIEFVSIYRVFKNNNDYLPNPTNIHPSNEGYKAIYLEIMKQLKK